MADPTYDEIRQATILNPATPGGSLSLATPAPNQVQHPDAAYWAQEHGWSIMAANLQGIDYLKQSCATFLPKFPRERDDSYALRVALSCYTPLIARLISGCVGLILRDRIHIEAASESEQEWWESWRLDVDRTGTSIDDFAKMLLSTSIGYGHASILTDYPDIKARTLKEERDQAAMPYLMAIPPWSTIGRRQDPRVGYGKPQQIRVREQVEAPDGDYGIKLVERIRVLYPGRYELWEKSSTETGWALVTGGSLGIKDIPLTTTYGKKLGFLISEPPLIDCAHLNITHYQRRSDLTMALVVAAQPLLALMGFDESDENVELSVNNAIKLPMGGDGKYIEPTGQSFDALQTELAKLEEQITTLGISMMAKQQNFQESGLAKGLDRAESNSMLAGISHDLQITLQQSLAWVAEYAGIGAPEVKIDDDFEHAALEPAAAQVYLQAFINGAIDQETFLRAWTMGEWLDTETDPEEIIDATEEEAAAKMDQAMAVAAAKGSQQPPGGQSKPKPQGGEPQGGKPPADD